MFDPGGRGQLCLRGYATGRPYDHGHYYVTRKLAREVLMAAKTRTPVKFSSHDCSTNLNDSDEQTTGIIPQESIFEMILVVFFIV